MDLVVLGKTSGFKFRVYERSVHTHFEAPPVLGWEFLVDLVVLGKTSGFKFRVYERSVHTHFEAPPVGRHQYKAFDFGFELRDELLDQADRLRLIVSGLTVYEFDFHHLPPVN